MEKLAYGFGLALQITAIFIPFIFVACLFFASIEYIFNELSWWETYIFRVKSFVALILYADAVIISLTIYCYFSELALNGAEKFNQSRLKSFSFQKPLLYEKLQEELGEHDQYITIFFISNWLVGVITYVLFAFNFDHPFIAIAVVQTIFILGFYVSILREHKDLGRWTFYQVRAFILPYMLLLLPLFVGGAIAIFSLNWLMVEIFEFFNVQEVLKDYWLLKHLPDWTTSLEIILKCLIWSSGISLILIWVLPIFMRKDYVAIFITLLAILAPVITGFIVDKIEPLGGLVENLLSVPAPVFSLLLLLVVDKSYNFLKSLLTPNIFCPKCGNGIPESDNYCNVCGTKRPDRLETKDQRP